MDGCPRGLSARRFAAAAGALGSQAANSAWLERQGGGAAAAVLDDRGDRAGEEDARALRALQQQAALGHLINHPPPGQEASVFFDICPLPASALAARPRLGSLIPSLAAGAGQEPGRSGGGWFRRSAAPRGGYEEEGEEVRWVPLVVAARALQEGGRPVELFVDYGVDPLGLGYQP